MNERTVTGQAELDAALADDTVTIVVIDSPAGVWLNIDSTNGKVVNVAGQSTIDTLSGTARVGTMYDTARVGTMSGTARVGTMYDTASVDRMSGTASVGTMSGTARVGGMSGTARVGGMSGTARVGGMSGTARVDRMYDTARVGTMYDTARVDRMYDTARVGGMYDTARVENAHGATAIQGVHNDATVHAGPYVAIHLYSATATVDGGHIIDMTQLDKLSGEDWCAAMGINASLLRSELEYITAHPAEWNQGIWAQRSQCGTACCLAGGVVLRAGIPLSWNDSGKASYTEDGVEISLEARRLFGLSMEDASCLFEGSNSLESLWRIAAEITYGAIQVPATLPV